LKVKERRRRVHVLWVALIAAFLVIWQVLQEPAGATHAARTANRSSPRSAQSSGGFAVMALPVGFLVLGLGWVFVFQRRLRRFNAESALALKLFSGAEYAASADRFAEIVQRYRGPRILRATASFNLATARLRNAEFDRAVELLSSIDPWLPRYAPALAPTVAAELAGLYALRGDAAAAEQWVAEATARAQRVAPPRPIAGRVAFVQAVNALRRGEQPAAAAQVLDAAWEDLDRTLVGVELRPFRALRAFAAARGGGPSPRASSATAVAALAEARPGELAWLGAEWPEMRAFLEGAAAAPPPRG